MPNSKFKSRVSVSKGRKSGGKTTVRVSSNVTVNTRSRRTRPATKRTNAKTKRTRSRPKRLTPKSIQYIPVIIASSTMKKRRRVKKSPIRTTAAPNISGLVVMRSVHLVRSSLENVSQPKVSTASMGKLMSAASTVTSSMVPAKITPMTAFNSNPPMTAAAPVMPSVVPAKITPTPALQSKPATPATAPVMSSVAPAKITLSMTALKSKPATPATAPVMPSVVPAPTTALKNKPPISAPQSACTNACKVPSKNTLVAIQPRTVPLRPESGVKTETKSLNLTNATQQVGPNKIEPPKTKNDSTCP